MSIFFNKLNLKLFGCNPTKGFLVTDSDIDLLKTIFKSKSLQLLNTQNKNHLVQYIALKLLENSLEEVLVIYAKPNGELYSNHEIIYKAD